MHDPGNFVRPVFVPDRESDLDSFLGVVQWSLGHPDVGFVLYFVYDVLPLRLLAFPSAVVGMNSIAMYLMGRLMRGWTIKNIQIHFGV